ncbi:MAG: DUF4149 domain-containing protein [Neisseriaceae bacterium]|jgi:hypothetical protein|nr:MAG: DUF4149 domain-containing protein [Neisseriaceae bacterium]
MQKIPSPRKKKSITNNPKFEIFTLRQISHVISTFWIGGTLTIATVIIPLLFRNLDQISAANIAGQIFDINAYIGMSALVLAMINTVHINGKNFIHIRKFWYALIMEGLLAINYFAIFPIIITLRSKLIDATNKVFMHNNEFSMWHSLSTILFILCCLFGVLFLIEKDN